MSATPLLTGQLADRARAAADAIVLAMVELTERSAEHTWPFLAGGDAGTAIVLAHYAAATGNERARTAADTAMGRALDAAAEAPLNGDLYAGILGIGWALARLEHLSGGLDTASDDERDDEVLAAKVLTARPWPGVHDLTRGLVGIGIHALELWPGADAQHRLATVVACLDETARPATDGVAWWTDPATVLPERAAQFPDGYVDLGVAHGQAGVLALSAVAARLGVDSAHGLAMASAEHLLSWRRNVEDDFGRYPSLGMPREPATGSRLAWCYGDAGMAWALHVAADALGDQTLADEAYATALAAARRRPDTAGVNDAGLCHGAMGVAHALACVGEPRGDEEILAASRAWVERALDHRDDDAVGIAGFVAMTPGADGALAPQPSIGLLEGAGGVALSLLSATTGDTAPWDRFLMPQVPAP